MQRFLQVLGLERSVKLVPVMRMSTSVDSTFIDNLSRLRFDNVTLRELPLDHEKKNFTRTVPNACFSLVEPTPLNNPKLVSYSSSALSLIDLDLTDANLDDVAEYFSGNRKIPGTETAAHCYCGHQFGNFAGQLGDGAAMYLGEVINKNSERWEIQFKGSGTTPYSRSADGRKVLRSTIREFLCSEAIHHLGIPTTRAGVCVTSDTKIIRDIFYNGNQILERASVVLRLAPTFIRFGSFEIFKDTDPVTGRMGPSHGNNEMKKLLLNFVVKQYYPQLWAEKQSDGDLKKMYLNFFKEITQRTASLVALWQSVGWCHGVLNTDNMSIIGVTIDYGPFGFMDDYDPDFICNGSDDGGRYTYAKQPEVCRWNCEKLAEALSPLIEKADSDEILKCFDETFASVYIDKMRKKFGLFEALDEDESLISSFLDTLQVCGADFTNSFRSLSTLCVYPSHGAFEQQRLKLLSKLMASSSSLANCLSRQKPRMDQRQLQMMVSLLQQNPSLLESMGASPAHLLNELKRMKAYKELQDKTEEGFQQTVESAWKLWIDRYKARLEKEYPNPERHVIMNQNNPKFILRNYIAQEAINEAENGNYAEMNRVLKLLENPYEEEPEITAGATSSEGAASSTGKCAQEYAEKPPAWSLELRVT